MNIAFPSRVKAICAMSAPPGEIQSFQLLPAVTPESVSYVLAADECIATHPKCAKLYISYMSYTCNSGQNGCSRDHFKLRDSESASLEESNPALTTG